MSFVSAVQVTSPSLPSNPSKDSGNTLEKILEDLLKGTPRPENDDHGKEEAGSGNAGQLNKLIAEGTIAFERDARRNEDDETSERPEDQNVVRNTIEQLLKSDPEFSKAFYSVLENGLKINFRYNADESRAEIVNGNVLLVDIKPGDDITEKLKEFFNGDSNYQVDPPDGSRSVEEVLTDTSLTGQQMVAELEAMNVFDFAGPHADEIRKDIADVFGNSPFNRAVLLHSLQKDPNQTWTFSTIGRGGGTVSEPLDGHNNVLVAAEDGYSGGDQLWSHEFYHSALEIPDDARIEVADAIHDAEQGHDTKGRGVQVDPDTFARLDMHKFFQVIDGLAGKHGDDIPTTDEIINQSLVPENQLTGGTPRQAFENDLNAIVSAYRDEIDLDNKSVPPLEGEMAERFKDIVRYYTGFIDPDATPEEAAAWARDQIVGRLGGAYSNPRDGAHATRILGDHFDQEDVKNATVNLARDTLFGHAEAAQINDDALNGLVFDYHRWFTENDGWALDNRKVPLSAAIEKNYKIMMDYYLKYIDPKGSKEDAAIWAFEQVKGRLPGVFPDPEPVPFILHHPIVFPRDDGAYANDILDGWFERHGGLDYIINANG